MLEHSWCQHFQAVYSWGHNASLERAHSNFFGRGCLDDISPCRLVCRNKKGKWVVGVHVILLGLIVSYFLLYFVVLSIRLRFHRPRDL
jgi:hypothetical protein